MKEPPLKRCLDKYLALNPQLCATNGSLFFTPFPFFLWTGRRAASEERKICCCLLSFVFICFHLYIGMTTMKLSRRLSYHLSSGAPKKHLQDAHNIPLKRQDLDKNTEILSTQQDPRRLCILEALHTKDLSPNLNIQAIDLQALPSMRRSSPLDSQVPTDDVIHLPANRRAART